MYTSGKTIPLIGFAWRVARASGAIVGGTEAVSDLHPSAAILIVTQMDLLYQ